MHLVLWYTTKSTDFYISMIMAKKNTNEKNKTEKPLCQHKDFVYYIFSPYLSISDISTEPGSLSLG